MSRFKPGLQILHGWYREMILQNKPKSNIQANEQIYWRIHNSSRCDLDLTCKLLEPTRIKVRSRIHSRPRSCTPIEPRCFRPIFLFPSCIIVAPTFLILLCTQPGHFPLSRIRHWHTLRVPLWSSISHSCRLVESKERHNHGRVSVWLFALVQP
ncbi:hypothetical protein BKA70DRAFT_624899 [Coprinopsis sp. MPI-PUGE-AT-0042]|nr:hypothetical protein BKA70DRAFT_624899 [Coprinopsis sp. MPI-PUGE-AT-0042]